MGEESVDVRVARLEERADATEKLTERLTEDIRDTKQLILTSNDKFDQKISDLGESLEKKLDAAVTASRDAVDTSRRAIPGLAQALIGVLLVGLSVLTTLLVSGARP